MLASQARYSLRNLSGPKSAFNSIGKLRISISGSEEGLYAMTFSMLARMETQVCSLIEHLAGKSAASKSLLRRQNEIRYLLCTYSGSEQGKCPAPLILLDRVLWIENWLVF